MPIVDNYGHIEIHMTESRENSFLPNINLMESSSIFNIPIQAIYDYLYNHHKPQKRQGDIKTKQL